MALTATVVFVLWAPAHGNDRVSEAGTMGLLLRATEDAAHEAK